MSIESTNMFDVTSDSHDGNPWAIDRIEPSTLIAFWPGAMQPTMIEVLAALQQHCGREFRQIDDLESDAVLWNGVFETPQTQQPIILWAETAKGNASTEIAEIQSCKWVVGAETILDPDHALHEYTALLRALAGGLGCTTILDTITHRYWQAQALADLTADSPSSLSVCDLWTIHAVREWPAREQGALWLHTHGLWRCGCAELEMLEVPHEHGNAAASLLNEIATLAMDAGLAAPGEPMEIGPQVMIATQPWEIVAPHVDLHNGGGMNDREGENNPHAGVRAVICAPQPRGVFRKVWTWPEQAVRHFQQDDAIIYRTSERTARQAELARARWDDFATAFAATRSLISDSKAQHCVFLVKAALPATDGNPNHKEHVWFEISQMSGQTARGKLLSKPMFVNAPVNSDDAAIHREQVSDWGVQIMKARFGPADVPALWRAIHQLSGDAS